MDIAEQKAALLATYLNIDPSEVSTMVFGHYETDFECDDGSEWLVLTDDEADDEASAHVQASPGQFHEYFLAQYTPEGVSGEIVRAIQVGSLDPDRDIREMIGPRWASFVADAIAAEGRGHFLSSEDGDEHEIGKLEDGREVFAYRVG